MMDKPKISIAMCTYMGKRFLREQIDSILQQTRLPDEIVICDDGSRDGTIELIKTLSASFPFPIKLVINQKTLGSSKNFEQAISLCTGSIIALSDQDDIWHKNKLEAIEEKFLTSENIGLVFSNANVVSEKLSPLGYTLWDSYSLTNKRKARFMKGQTFDVLLNHNVVTGATMAFRAELRDIFMPIPTNWVHDSWIAIVISSSSIIRMIDECLVDYRQHEKQQIGGTKKSFKQNINLAQSVTDYTKQIEQYQTLLDLLQNNSHSYLSSQVNDKINHLIARHKIYNSSLPKKLYYIAQELYTRRYFKYSKGVCSISKDLFLDMRQKMAC